MAYYPGQGPYYQQPYQMNYQTGYQPNYQYNPVQMPQAQQVPQQVMRQPLLNGQMVDSIEAVKAKDVDMSGNPTFYPNINGEEIYKKQLQADGTCTTLIYKLAQEPTPVAASSFVDMQTFHSTFSQLMTELEGIKQMLTNRQNYKDNKGGKKYESNDITNPNVQ